MTTTDDQTTTTADLGRGDRRGAPTLVLGATGKTGRRVAARLSGAGYPVRSASRSSAVFFDWHDESTWGPALDGAGGVYLVPPEPGTRIGRFVDLVAASDVDRIVVLSARNPSQSGDDHLGEVEAAVTGSSTSWVILRPSWFAQNFDEGFFAAAVAGGTLRLPVGDGREPFIDADDIADVAVASLIDRRHEGHIYELSGPEPLTFAEAVAHLGTATERPLTFADTDAETFAVELREHGTPPEEIASFTRLFAAIRAGDNDYVSDGVLQALGRPPAPFASYAERVGRSAG